MTKRDDKLHTVLVSIEESLKKQNSMRRAFGMGLLRGLGTAIGATILFAIFTSVVLHFVDSTYLRSLVKSMFEVSNY